MRSEERPTLVPPFDLEDFAKRRMRDSTRPPRPSEPPWSSPVVVLRDTFLAGDHATTLTLCEELLRHSPNDPEALHYAELCRSEIEATYFTALGGPASVPTRREGAHGQPLDGVEAFVFALIDGVSSVQMLVEASDSDSLSTLCALYQLVRQGRIDVG